MKLDKASMARIGKEHRISPADRREFLKLANDGRIDNKAFGKRLCFRRNYDRAMVAVMEVLSQGLVTVHGLIRCDRTRRM